MASGESKATMRTIPDSITQLALELGADAAGVAPVERFVGEGASVVDVAGSYLPTGYAPGELLPGARSVIVVAVHVLEGVMTSNRELIHTTFAYGNFGYVYLNRRLSTITYDLASRLEAYGWPSLPLGPCGVCRLYRSAYEEGRSVGPLHGIFSLKRAAVLAGVGRRARSGLVATPRYGTRVRLGAVITTAPLEGSPVIEGSPCPPSCGQCARACPMGAIGEDGVVNHVKCYSDMGRRGRSEVESLEEMANVYPAGAATEGYLPHENSAIDGFGNRMCRSACMGVCPLWKLGDRQIGSTA